MSKLNEDGCIPVRTVCPYKKECGDYVNFCNHKGVNHTVPYSCALARGLEIVAERK